jgi:hypothetical protein
LLVTDAYSHVVHIVDIQDGVHIGFLATSSSLGFAWSPQGITSRGRLVAVTCCDRLGRKQVIIFENQGHAATAWAVLREFPPTSPSFGISRGYSFPLGVRFSGDGRSLIVVDHQKASIDKFRVHDGVHECTVACDLKTPCDVEEFADGVVATSTRRGLYVVSPSHSTPTATLLINSNYFYYGNYGKEYVSLARLPVHGFGVVVNAGSEGNGASQKQKLLFFATADTIALAAMSPVRVAWMAAVSAVSAVVRKL